MGTQLDHFELLDCIGMGGMGRVFRARDTHLDRLVAIKVLSPELAGDQEVSRRFEQEAKAAARLDDHHFARVFFFSEDKGLRYIAMELVEGDNLKRMIDRSGRLDYRLVLNVGLQIASGLAHAAQVGVVHRDIKPSNIIVTHGGTAKLVDMGLARDFFQHSHPDTGITQAGMTLGTFDYISPEQASDPRDADVRSDIYSLGCTMYHALTGRAPYPTGSALQKLLQHTADEIPDARKHVQDLPDGIALILRKMMAKLPKDRYQSPAELIADLRNVIRALYVPLPDDSSFSVELFATPRDWERQWSWIVPMSVLIVAVGIYALISRATTSDWSAPEYSPILARAPSASRDRPTTTPSPTVNPVPVTSDNRTTDPRVARGLELRRQLREARDGDIVEVTGDCVFEAASDSGMEGVLQIRREVTIRASQQLNVLPVITLRDSAAEPARSRLCLLGIAPGANVTLERLAFRIEPSVLKARQDVTTILHQGLSLKLRDCYFASTGGLVSPASSAVEISSSLGGTLDGQHCFFAGGNDAFRVLSPTSVISLHNCAIAQYRRPFVFLGDAERSRWELSHVTVFQGEGPVFTLSSIAGFSGTVSQSVFARLAPASEHPLIRASSNRPRFDDLDRNWWQGERNLYQGLDRQFLQLDGSPAVVRETELGVLRGNGFQERDVTEISWGGKSPWMLEDPLTVPSDPPEQAMRAFQLSATSGVLAKGDSRTPLGVIVGPWGPLYPESTTRAAPSPPAISKSIPKDPLANNELTGVAAPNTLSALIVDPAARPGGQSGVYASFRAACDEAPLGRSTTIELRSNEVIWERDILVENKDLSIVAGAGSTPVLRLRLTDAMANEATSRRLFRVQGRGRLRITGVGLQIEPTTETERNVSASLIECGPDADVRLEKLWVRVGAGARPLPFAVFRVLASTKGANAGLTLPIAANERGANGPSRLTMDRVGIRASGNLLAAEPNALWEFTMADSFAVNLAPAIQVDGTSQVAGLDQPNEFRARQSSLSLADALVWLRTQGVGSEVPRRIEIDAQRSLFIGPGNRDVALSLVSGDTPRAFQQNAISWNGSGNFFAGHDILTQYSGTDGVMTTAPERIPREEWPEYWRGEFDSLIGPLDVGSLRPATTIDAKLPSAAELRSLGYQGPTVDILRDLLPPEPSF